MRLADLFAAQIVEWGNERSPRLARSLDGGRTWSTEAPKSLLPPEQGGKPVEALREPMNFTAPGFAMTLRLTDTNKGPSRLWFTQDKGKSWQRRTTALM